MDYSQIDDYLARIEAVAREFHIALRHWEQVQLQREMDDPLWLQAKWEYERVGQEKISLERGLSRLKAQWASYCTSCRQSGICPICQRRIGWLRRGSSQTCSDQCEEIIRGIDARLFGRG